MPKSVVSGVCCALVALASANGSAAQANDPIEVAIRYAIEIDSLSTVPGRIAIDSTTARLGPATRAQMDEKRISRLAESLGARLGTMKDLRVCPPQPLKSLQDCRLRGNVEVVLHVSEIAQTEKGLRVVIDIWEPGPRRKRDGFAVGGWVIYLSRGADDAWRATDASPIAYAA
jgi:hypothetical protein